MDCSRNIAIASWRSFFSMFLLIMPVAVPYWRSLGLSMHEVLELQAIFGLSVVIFEVPTGYVADVYGRKISVVLGSLISGLSFSYLPFADTYNSLLTFEIAIALGCSLVSGAEDAIVYESIPSIANRRQILGSFRVWSLLGETSAALLAGALVMYSFTPILWAQAFVGWVPFVLALSIVEPPKAALPPTLPYKGIVGACYHTICEDPVRRLVFINFVIWGLSSFCVVWLLQEYWARAGIPLNYFGIMWAALMLVSAITSKYAHAIESVMGASRVMIILAVAPVIGYLLMAHAPVGIGAAAGLLFYVTRGLTYVVFQDEFNRRVQPSFRATANSLQSLCFRLAFVPIGPLLGSLIDKKGLAYSLDVLALAFCICLVAFLFPLVRILKALDREPSSAQLDV